MYHKPELIKIIKMSSEILSHINIHKGPERQICISILGIHRVPHVPQPGFLLCPPLRRADPRKRLTEFWEWV